MTNLQDLLTKVRDSNLSLPLVEKYRDELIHLRTDLKRQEADLKKKRALFLLACEEKAATMKNIQWDGTPDGQLLIDVRGDLGGLSGEIDSLQSRIYSLIR